MESTERPIPLPSASPSSPDQLPHNCTVTSASTAFDSTNVSGTSSPTSQTSALAGNPAFYQDISEVMEYFECDVDAPYVDAESTIYAATVKLPIQHAGSLSHLTLTINARPSADNTTYHATYQMEPRTEETTGWSEGDIKELLCRATKRCRLLSRRSSDQSPSMIGFIDSFYYCLEDWLHPHKESIVRDFCYSVYDPRHWGRPFPGLLDRFPSDEGSQAVWKAKARFDFDAAAEGELSIRENELLLILGNLGNGWLTARRHPASSLPRDVAVEPFPFFPSQSHNTNTNTNTNANANGNTGLIPENYVVRLL